MTKKKLKAKTLLHRSIAEVLDQIATGVIATLPSTAEVEQMIKDHPWNRPIKAQKRKTKKRKIK